MDGIDLEEERRTEEREAQRRAEADARAGIVVCPTCQTRVHRDDLRTCDATAPEGKDCRRQGCTKCIQTDSAGNHYCGPACGLDLYRELMAFEERNHKELMAWYRERIAALEAQG